MLLHVGLDDTDSEEGMCTTYVGAVILDELERSGIEKVEHPHLIRLNPNWKWKTRGNCAISFTVEVEEKKIGKVKEITLEKVEELAELQIEETTPGVVFFKEENIPKELKSFSQKVIKDVATLEEAENLASKIGAEIHKFREGRGIIGALAAVGHPLKQDFTYELIAYRNEKNWGTPRRIVDESVEVMNEATFPETFDNLDPETGEIRITPHTPCPILYGIRSENPETVYEAQKIVEEEEPIERIMLFKTNQGTDEHLQTASIGEVEPYQSVIVEGKVFEEPETITGGHVFFSIKEDGQEIKCAAFEPTRRFRDTIRKLVKGDRVKVYGGIKEKPEHSLTINLEKIEILDLVPVKKEVNPLCEKCDKRMKSSGKDKGYYCEKCGRELPEEAKEKVEVDRELEIALYEVPPRARRHLAKPRIRKREN